MDRTKLIQLIQAGLQPETVPAEVIVENNFTDNSFSEAAISAILEHFNLPKDASLRDVRPFAPQIMALIEEQIDEILPKRLENVMGQFAEIKTFARDAKVVFKLNKLGKRRARLTISKGARGGIYRAARLDSDIVEVQTWVETVGVFITLEDLLLGRYTLAELFSNILEGFEELIYKEVIEALVSAQVSAGTSPNYYVVDGSSVTLEDALDDALAVVKQYGTPMIMGFSTTLAKIANVTTVGTPVRPEASLNDVRNYGYVRVYKGISNILEIPNYLTDDTNLSWELNDDYAFVLPIDAKPVKVAFQGDLTLVQNNQLTGSEKWEAHKILGVSVLMKNNYAVIKAE